MFSQLCHEQRCTIFLQDARQRSSNFGQSSDSEVSDIESGTMSSRTYDFL